MSIVAIVKFERQKTINVNVYGYDDMKKDEDGEGEFEVYPLRISKITEARHVDFLFLVNTGKQQHYCWIWSLSRLLTSQVTDHKELVYFFVTSLGRTSGTNTWNIAAKRMQSEWRCQKDSS